MKLFIRTILIVSVVDLILGAAIDLPKDFKTCKRSDPIFEKCLVAAINDGLTHIKPGLPEFGILPIDPLAIDSMKLSHGSADSLFKLRQEFKNVKIYNISNSIVKHAALNWDKYSLKTYANTPRLEMISDYVMNGQILAVPIAGSGKANITLIDVAAEHELIGEPHTHNNELYWHFKDYKFKSRPKRVYMHFENLFNGDKALSDVMNTVLNDNWETVFNEMKDSYEKTFEFIFKDISNKLFSKVPINKIWRD